MCEFWKVSGASSLFVFYHREILSTEDFVLYTCYNLHFSLLFSFSLLINFQDGNG